MQRAKLLATAQLQQRRLQLGNWATGGQLGSGTRFQMHFACVIKMSLIYGQPEPSPGPTRGRCSKQQAAGSGQKELPVFPHFGYHLPQRRSTFSHRVAGE